MGSEYILSARYSDKNISRDVTEVLREKVLGTTLDVDVDEKMIPPFATTPKVELTPRDEKRIRDAASRRCGGVDQECIRATEARMRQETLEAKTRVVNSSVNIVNGRRLTVRIVGTDGAVREVVIPDGQKFNLKNVSPNDPITGKGQLPSFKYFQAQLFMLFGIVVAVVVYVFGILATYTVFTARLGPLIGAGLTVVAVFIPYSGYLMIFGYFMAVRAIDIYVKSVQ